MKKDMQKTEEGQEQETAKSQGKFKENGEREHLPNWREYEKAMAKFGSKLTENYVKGRYADWMDDPYRKELDKDSFARIIRDETADYIVEEVMERIEKEGLEDYFEPSFVLEKIIRKQQGKPLGWFWYWLEVAQNQYRYKDVNSGRIERRKMLDAKVLEVAKDEPDYIKVAKKVGVTPNHVHKVLRRNKAEKEAENIQKQAQEKSWIADNPTSESESEISESEISEISEISESKSENNFSSFSNPSSSFQEPKAVGPLTEKEIDGVAPCQDKKDGPKPRALCKPQEKPEPKAPKEYTPEQIKQLDDFYKADKYESIEPYSDEYKALSKEGKNECLHYHSFKANHKSNGHAVLNGHSH